MTADAAAASHLSALLGRFARAVAAHDADGFASPYTPDGRYHDGFFGVHEGREAIAAMLERFYVGGEAFDRGIAFTQLGYELPRIGKLLGRYTREFTASSAARAHLAARPDQAGRPPGDA